MSVQPARSHDAPSKIFGDRVVRSPVGISPLLPRLAFIAGYVALLLWFHGIDVYHRHFATAGALIAIHNLFRVLFIFYLFWMVQAVGAAFLRLIARGEFERLGLLVGLALGFFAGTGVWHVAMLVLGYLELYRFPVAVIVTLPVVVVASGNVTAAARVLSVAVSRGNALRRNLGGHESTLLGWLVVPLAIVAFILLLLVKGLYPGGGHDYFTHYFYYYQTVIDRGGLWPNEVWYHYYYSKGAGLYFLAMLLTDPMAPQLVTFCFMAAAALVILLLCRRAAPGTAWPLVAATLFLAAYIYTPIWGQFEKLHELNTAFIIAILWASAGTLERSHSTLTWGLTAALSIVAAVIVNITVAAYLGPVFCVLALWYLGARQVRRSLVCLAFAGVTGTALIVILTINYVTTGLINDQGILLLWQFADVEKLDQLGYLQDVLKLYWGWEGMVDESVPLSFKLVRFLVYSSRLDLLFPLVAGGAIAAMVTIVQRGGDHVDSRPPPRCQAAVLAAMLTVFIAIALVAGRAQPSSFFRYSSFAMPLLIVGAIILGTWPTSRSSDALVQPVRDRRTPAAMLALTLIAIVIAASQRERFFNSVLPRAMQFASGGMSLDRAYTLQVGWPDKPWGAIYPGARGAYNVVGPHTPIWSMHLISYCMLPDCRIESTESFSIGRGWDTLMFGTPEQGRSALQTAGINYFLYSRELPVIDQLPLSPLLRPDNIARYLGVRWTDGTSALLTWLGPDTVPLDAAWLAAYRRTVEQSSYIQSFPYSDMQTIFLRLKQIPHPWRSFELPWKPKITAMNGNTSIAQ